MQLITAISYAGRLRHRSSTYTTVPKVSSCLITRTPKSRAYLAFGGGELACQAP
ncbi:MAG: hypothetical protein V7K38_19290 [Nostoc sp.]|uniref:hypothetical protein n=1 Tax=Nostoc sp. TaxID=1180 RepID=UPI002FF4C246